MAVYTKLCAKDVQLICQTYGIGEPCAIQPIAQGMENSNYFLQCDDGREWVITLFEEISAEQVAFFCQLLQQLPSHNIPVAAPINTLAGTGFIMLFNKPLILCPKIDGQHLENPNLKQCQAISQALANFHNFSETKAQAFVGVRSISWLASLLENNCSLLNTHEQTYLKATIKQFQQVQTLPGLRKGLCHCDLFRDNSLFAGNQLKAVLDFYSASEHFYIFDLAVLINDWAHNPSINLSKQQAMVKAYQSVRPLTDAELHYLPFFLQLAAMRFWLSRLLENKKAARETGDIKPFEPCRQLFFDLVLH